MGTYHSQLLMLFNLALQMKFKYIVFFIDFFWLSFLSNCNEISVVYIQIIELVYFKAQIINTLPLKKTIKEKTKKPTQNRHNDRKLSKLKYPTLQHCLRMLHIMHTTIMKGGIGQSGSKP